MKQNLLPALLAWCLVAALSSVAAHGQYVDRSRVINHLDGLGYSHVEIEVSRGVSRIGFQNRRFRDEGRAVHEILESLGENASPGRYTLVGRARGIDIYNVDATDGRVSVHPARAAAAFDQPFLVDVVVHPFFGALLGSYSQPVRARTGIAPEIAVYPWKGGRISAQMEVVFVDDVNLNPKRLSPGLASISQWMRVPVGQTYAAGGAGLFSHERYGLYADVQSLFFGGRIALHGSAAYTGLAALENRTWYISSLDQVQVLAGVEYVHPGVAASVLVRGGRFLEGDEGVRVDVRRAFGAFQIGFFGVSTNLDNTAGLAIRIPLLPARHAATPVRVVPARQLPIEYRYSAAGGRILRTGYEIDLFANQLHPFVVDMQLQRAREGRSIFAR
jgi:hypothetical protein